MTHCARTCRACLSVSIETLRAVARACYGVTVWLHRMWCSQCVSNRLLWRLFLCMGRCERLLHRRSQSLPALRGSTPSVATPHFCRPPGSTCRRSPGPLVLPPSHSLDRAAAGVSAHARASPEPETTAGQPAPVSTKAPGTRDHCRATGPRVYKSSLTWSHRGQPALVTTTGLFARAIEGNRPSCLPKQF